MESPGGLLGASWGSLGGSWDDLGGQDEAKMGPSWAKLRLSCVLEPSWRQLGGHLQDNLT